MSNQEKINIELDLNIVNNYTKLVMYHFRRFKKNCDSCYSKTEKEFIPVYNDLWNLIHCLPFKLKTDINSNNLLKRNVEIFYNKFKSLPCNICKKHFNEIYQPLLSNDTRKIKRRSIRILETK